MIGGARADDEKKTVNALQRLKTDNVRVLLNQPLALVKQELWHSKVFLHTADSEPAALSIVEAIAAGCIPVVRKSGGSAELVGFPELTFTSVEEAKEMAAKALAGDYDDYLPRLSTHIAQSDESVFCDTFINAIENVSSRSR
jgi:glycosyltransferase involved in cell wall biosynthesis